MKNKFSYFLLLLSCVGCSSLKTEKESFISNQQLELLQQDSLRLQERSAEALVLHDSAEVNISVTIWPKGAFSYSPSEGFKGRADSMLLQQQLKQGRVVALKQAASRTLKVGNKQQLNRQEMVVQEQRTKERKRAGPVVFWVVLALVGVGGVWWFWRR